MDEDEKLIHFLDDLANFLNSRDENHITTLNGLLNTFAFGCFSIKVDPKEYKQYMERSLREYTLAYRNKYEREQNPSEK